MQQTQQRIQQLQQRLNRIRAFHYQSTPGPLSMMGWQGEGHGQVTVEHDGEACLFHEAGHFHPSKGQTIALFNCFEWCFESSAVRLSHRRRGSAVYLFHLMPEGDGRWVSETPHYCGDDVYSGVLTMTDDGLMLDWRVTGPRKDEHFHYCYTSDAGSDDDG